ncbi:Uncharacterised protein [Yersinia pseudotuberculosis]|uniref:Uncharacterized protein n=2 Tax=Yersinia pseudotuberculosis complex TaxID=1649845 RepID=A0A0T9Q4G2_9GAMM|nr:Uncharacterised protein [Yersinia similis]CFQ92454.1 Uncharacterised protein [Yersinia pseudotuberculosis]CRG50175.1 Uncharacterised protein [Yersinia wautersii]CFV25540.1 Uncharacterised protein [Yersinia pseudotuberculosis]CNC70859.1 Uncharacterised protein [Yersinia similis]
MAPGLAPLLMVVPLPLSVFAVKLEAYSLVARSLTSGPHAHAHKPPL